jgi:UDP-GlcNAc3NAcA epimerase
MKILTILGARPQFIKAAVVSRAFKQYRKDVREVLVHTGQHYDANMSDVFFDELDIPHPDYNLGIGGGTHGQNTGRMIEKVEEILLKEKPDWVLVYGDTDSTLAGALAAAKLHIPVAHVEAGLRSFNRRMPEEINRVLTDHVASILFVPTSTAKKNLSNEGIDQNKIQTVGDVMYDAALYYKEKARKPPWFDNLKMSINEFVLCTIHRAENTDEPERLREIFQGLSDCDLPMVLPLHPRTRGKLASQGIVPAPNIQLTEPVGYLEMVWLEMNCKLIVTDSGGVQKEAYFHGKPCITLRDETEWLELVESGNNQLVGADASRISSAVSSSFHVSGDKELYGRGVSGVDIVHLLIAPCGQYLSKEI